MKTIKNFLVSLFDFYLNYSFLLDIFFFFIIVLLQKRSHIFIVPDPSIDQWIQNAFPNIISTSISLSGFILAALTIIVTFKSSIKAKLDDEGMKKLNGLELILSTPHYLSIINLFKKVLYEFLFVFVTLSFFWLFQKSFTNDTIFFCLIYSALAISLALLRTMIVLFKILILDK